MSFGKNTLLLSSGLGLDNFSNLDLCLQDDIQYGTQDDILTFDICQAQVQIHSQFPGSFPVHIMSFYSFIFKYHVFKYKRSVKFSRAWSGV